MVVALTSPSFQVLKLIHIYIYMYTHGFPFTLFRQLVSARSRSWSWSSWMAGGSACVASCTSCRLPRIPRISSAWSYLVERGIPRNGERFSEITKKKHEKFIKSARSSGCGAWGWRWRASNSYGYHHVSYVLMVISRQKHHFQTHSSRWLSTEVQHAVTPLPGG